MMKRLFFILIVFCCSCKSEGSDRILLTVKRNYTIPKAAEDVRIAIPWKALTKQMPAALTGVKITDQNFGRGTAYKLVDSNADRVIDFLVIDYKFESTEPIFTFLIEPDQAPTVLNRS